MLDAIIPFLEQHAWEIATITLAPLVGFIVARYTKIFIADQPKPTRRKWLMSANAFATGMFAFWTWPGSSMEESLKVAVLISMLGPLIVWIWFSAAAKWSPKSVSAISGTKENENWHDMTYFNMFAPKVEKKDEDV